MTEKHKNLAAVVYEQVRAELFDFRLLPGDRFKEAEVAARTGASRTPVREALYRLQQEGYLEVHFRNGWLVKPLDFPRLDESYDLRIVLEQTAVKRLEALDPEALEAILAPLESIWLTAVPLEIDARQIADLDEQFHCQLVKGAGNREMARVHLEATEKVRIIRRLDFTQPERVQATYAEHAAILLALRKRRREEASRLLEAHITVSRIEVRNLTLHRLQSARLKE
ncbi:MAG: GntR family transcriptional regulator [Fibrobacterota bacterium]|nr:GntR family transcriptional regulator [Fibrobacterota bacterium]QQS03140.1 MAG: GntR family transcriptional regulator [Fibrobacterota bacterium]